MPVTPLKVTVPGLKRKQEGPKSHPKQKGNGRYTAQIWSLNLGMSDAGEDAGPDGDRCGGKISINTFGTLRFVEARYREEHRLEPIAEGVVNDTQRVA